MPKAKKGANSPSSQVISGSVVVQSDPDPGGAIVPVPAAQPPRSPAPRKWKWSKAKKDAFRLALNGVGPSEIAGAVKVHRNTIRNWMLSPEWIAELRREVQEKQVATKFRRIAATSSIADKLWKKANDSLEEEDLDVGKASLLLREHRDYMRLEREHFGEQTGNGQPTGPMVNITIGGEGGGPREVKADSTAAVAFKDFLSAYDPGRLAIDASSPQEAVVEATRRLMQETDLLDKVREEDREEVVADAEAAEAAKGRKR